MVIPQTPLFSAILTSHLDPVASDTATATAIPSSSGGSSAAAVEGAWNTQPEAVAKLSQPTVSESSTFAAESTMVNNPLAAGHEASQFPPAVSIATGLSQPILDLGAGTSAADNAAADELAAELNALLSQSSCGTNPSRRSKNGPRQQKMAKVSAKRSMYLAM